MTKTQAEKTPISPTLPMPAARSRRHNACLYELNGCHSWTGGQGHTGTWLVNTAVSAQQELLKNFLSTQENSSYTTHQPYCPKGPLAKGNLAFFLSHSTSLAHPYMTDNDFSLSSSIEEKDK